MCVSEQSVRNAFAPPSRMVRDRLQTAAPSGTYALAHAAAHHRLLASAAAPEVQGSAGRQQVRHWRSRRRAALAHVRAREQVSAAEVATKARRAGPKNNPETGPFVEDTRQFGGSATGPRKSTLQMQISGRSSSAVL